MHGAEVSALVTLQRGRLAVEVMHVKHRRAVFLGAVADAEDLLEVIAAGILGVETPAVGGEVLLVDDQRVVLERQALGQLAASIEAFSMVAKNNGTEPTTYAGVSGNRLRSYVSVPLAAFSSKASVGSSMGSPRSPLSSAVKR